MPLDQDIAQATGVDLDRIKVQDYRNAQKAQAILHAQQVQTQQVASAGCERVAGEEEERRQLLLTLAAVYMRPSTATTPETLKRQMAENAARLEAAALAVWPVWQRFCKVDGA